MRCLRTILDHSDVVPTFLFCAILKMGPICQTIAHCSSTSLTPVSFAFLHFRHMAEDRAKLNSFKFIKELKTKKV